MKVALEFGESLEVALVQGDRIVGSLTLSLKGVGASPVVRSRATVAEAAAEEAPADAPRRGRRKGKGRRQFSEEARARIAEAQRKRWAAARRKKAK
jgi:hypothetical protein